MVVQSLNNIQSCLGSEAGFDTRLCLLPRFQLQSASSLAWSGAVTAGCSCAAAASDAGPPMSAVLFSAGRPAPARHSPSERAGL